MHCKQEVKGGIWSPIGFVAAPNERNWAQAHESGVKCMAIVSGRGAEHDFDGQDASLEEDGLDGFGRDPAEQGAGGRNGSGGQGCVKYQHSLPLYRERLNGVQQLLCHMAMPG